MENKNDTFLENICNARKALLRADVYCKIIKELFIFLGCEPFSEDILNYTLEEDIRYFIEKQEKKLSYLKIKEQSYDS